MIEKNFRLTGNEYFLNIAKAVSRGSTCLRRNYGAVIVKDRIIKATGYNGSPTGEKNCSDNANDFCFRRQEGIPHGEGYDNCVAQHAEMNAISQAGRLNTKGAVLFLYGFDLEKAEEIIHPTPCRICLGQIKNAGIKTIITKNKEINIIRKKIYSGEAG